MISKQEEEILERICCSQYLENCFVNSIEIHRSILATSNLEYNQINLEIGPRGLFEAKV